MSRAEIISQTTADLTGDGIPERVTLRGARLAGSAAWLNISLYAQDGASCLETRLPMPDVAGYDPRLWTGALTTPGKTDVLASVSSGGSGGIVYYYAFSYVDGAYQTIFDSEAYNAEYLYNVQYLAGYSVRAESLKNRASYLIDISARPDDYLSGIYTEGGALREPLIGSVNPLSLMYPADITGDGVNELVAFQRVTGLYNADGLGDFINTLSWDGKGFALINQTVGVFGTESA